MRRVEEKMDSKRAKRRDPQIVPLIVPHGCAEAGRDFESAFDVLPCEARVHELWRRRPAKSRLAR